MLFSRLKLKQVSPQQVSYSEEIIPMVLLLLAHFNEKEEHMFHFIEKTTLDDEVQMESVPPTPCLIVCGK